MADAAQEFLNKQLSKNRFTAKQQARLDASGGPSVAGSGDGVIPDGSAYDKYRPTSNKAPKKSDAEDYLDRYSDLQYWDTDSSEDGLHSGSGGVYNEKMNKSTKGWEKNWVKDMNKMYGTNHTDMNQFSKEQYSKAHFDLYGNDEGRTWGQTDTADTPEVKTEATPIEHSPEVKQATKRVRAYEDNIMSGKTSEDIFGDYYGKTSKNSFSDYYSNTGLDLNKTEAPSAQATATEQASTKATDSFLQNKKHETKIAYNFKPKTDISYGAN